MTDISLEQFQTAQNLITSLGLRTPLLRLPFIKTNQGHSILLKAENLQPSGSFKIRGTSYAISRLTASQRAKGVVAYSTGNHAQAVALAARMQNIRATIVMSPDAPEFKIQATKNYGAQVIMSAPTSEARRLLAEELALKNELALLPPYDHLDVMTGQGTIGLELLEQPNIGAVFVPIGGGGLIAGIANAIKKSRPEIKVIGVEPELENDAVQSFHSKKLVSLSGPSKSIADAIKVQSLGRLTFPIISRYVDDIVSVTEKQITEAALLMARESHLIVEPSGAVGLAGALIYNQTGNSDKVTVCVVSGGNTTLSFLRGLEA